MPPDVVLELELVGEWFSGSLCLEIFEVSAVDGLVVYLLERSSFAILRNFLCLKDARLRSSS